VGAVEEPGLCLGAWEAPFLQLAVAGVVPVPQLRVLHAVDLHPLARHLER